jgi:hypothetical protein
MLQRDQTHSVARQSNLIWNLLRWILKAESDSRGDGVNTCERGTLAMKERHSYVTRYETNEEEDAYKCNWNKEIVSNLGSK